jgi:hypothetical protein
MKCRPACLDGEPGAARIQAAKIEIEGLLRRMVYDEELKVFAYRWDSHFLDSGRQLCRLDLYCGGQAKSLSFDRRDLQDRDPEFWQRTVPCLIRQEVQEALA